MLFFKYFLTARSIWAIAPSIESSSVQTVPAHDADFKTFAINQEKPCDGIWYVRLKNLHPLRQPRGDAVFSDPTQRFTPDDVCAPNRALASPTHGTDQIIRPPKITRFNFGYGSAFAALRRRRERLPQDRLHQALGSGLRLRDLLV